MSQNRSYCQCGFRFLYSVSFFILIRDMEIIEKAKKIKESIIVNQFYDKEKSLIFARKMMMTFKRHLLKYKEDTELNVKIREHLKEQVETYFLVCKLIKANNN